MYNKLTQLCITFCEQAKNIAMVSYGNEFFSMVFYFYIYRPQKAKLAKSSVKFYLDGYILISCLKIPACVRMRGLNIILAI